MKALIIRLFQAMTQWRLSATLVANRRILVVTVQIALIALANWTALLLRFDGDIPRPYLDVARQGAPIVLAVVSIVLWAMGIQRGLWRYVGLHDLGRILWASVVAIICLYIILHGLLGWTHYPRSVIILTGVLSAMYLSGIRIAVRWLREWLQVLSPSARRVLIVGAGHAGELLVRDMLSDRSYHYRPVGLIDDDPVKRRRRIHGVPVVGRIEDISALVTRLVVHEILIAIPSASNVLKQRILAAASGCKVPIKVLPSVRQLLADPAAMRQLRPMSLEDLLQREPVQTDKQELHVLLEGKRVLVTGAGGSIGSELCRQIAQYKPASLILFERYENGLHELQLELREKFPVIKIVPVVGDVAVPDRVNEVLSSTRPELLFHAAAHKHVPLMEANPKEAIRNNVLGTKTVAEASLAAGVERFVLISTDKAVNPTSVMGATKRVAEELIQSLNRHGQTKFTVVRFGNVLGSNGSVVPRFAEQIQHGGPVTVTHPDIRRFFMTIPEAVQLVLQASVMGHGEDVFVLDMGEQIKVAELAKNMIVLSGLVPDQDIRIVYTGLRPGEKLFEELFEETEQVKSTSHPKIQRALRSGASSMTAVEQSLMRLELVMSDGDDESLIRWLQQAVPTYQPVSSRKVQATSHLT